MRSLEAATQLESDGPGRYSCDIDEGWAGTSGAVGGFAVALLAAAMRRELDASDGDQVLASLHVHFLRSLPCEPAIIRLGAVREGRSVSVWSLQLGSEERPAVQATATTIAPRSRSGYAGAPAPAPAPPGRDEAPWDPGIGMPAHERFRFWPRFSSPDDGPGPAIGGGWVLPRDPHPRNELLVAALSDLWYPPVLDRLRPPATVVGLSLVLHLRVGDVAGHLGPDEPLLLRLRTGHAGGGTVDEDGEIWSRTGVLLATTRQVRLVLAIG